MEDGRTRDGDRRPGARDLGNVRQVDSTVDLNHGAAAAAVDQFPDRFDLPEALRQEHLPGEAGIDGHDQDQVYLGDEFLERMNRRGRVDGHTRAGAALADAPDGAVQVRRGFNVYGHDRRTGIDELVDIAVGFGNHQVHVERNRRRATERADDGRAERDVRDEVAVHHVDVEQLDAGLLHARDFFAQTGEVGGEQRGRNLQAHWLSS